LIVESRARARYHRVEHLRLSLCAQGTRVRLLDQAIGEAWIYQIDVRDDGEICGYVKGYLWINDIGGFMRWSMGWNRLFRDPLGQLRLIGGLPAFIARAVKGGMRFFSRDLACKFRIPPVRAMPARQFSVPGGTRTLRQDANTGGIVWLPYSFTASASC